MDGKKLPLMEKNTFFKIVNRFQPEQVLKTRYWCRFIWMIRLNKKQAGAELCQAYFKLGFA
jgi:hypothetical protein